MMLLKAIPVLFTNSCKRLVHQIIRKQSYKLEYKFPENCTLKIISSQSSVFVKGTPELCRLIKVNAKSPEPECINMNHVSENVLEININPLLDKHSNATSVDISVPVNCNIFIQNTFGYIYLSDLESNKMQICSTTCNVDLKNVKSNSISVESTNSSINCTKLLHGNVSIKTNNGDISTGKIIGNEVYLETDCNIETGDIYAKEIYLNSLNGHISSKSLHGTSQITTENGNVKVNANEGEIDVNINKGDISVFFPVEASGTLSTNMGNVAVNFSENASAKINAASQNCSVDEKICTENEHYENIGKCEHYKSVLNSGPSSLRIDAPSEKVKLNLMSWFESLSIKT